MGHARKPTAARRTTPARRPAAAPAAPQVQYPTLAAYIADTRDTQAHIAQCVGLSQTQISKIARGLLVPRGIAAYRLARYARVPLDSFLREHVAQLARAAGVNLAQLTAGVEAPTP